MFYFKRRDDLEVTKSEPNFLDLSESIILTKEDLDKTLSKIPNLKLKEDPIEHIVLNKSIKESDKVIPDLSIDTKFVVKKSNPKKNNSKTTALGLDLNCETKNLFLNPISEPMTRLDVNDFCETDIDWKMLTVLRPKTTSDENYFSKLVELYKLRHKTRLEDGYGVREEVFRLSRHPRVMRYKPISFTRMDSFGLETNQSLNKIKDDITYEAFSRQPIDSQSEPLIDTIDYTIDDILSLTDTLDFTKYDK